MISVIITARNEPYLAMTIRSVQDATNIPIEFIAVLDGETDYSLPNYSNLTIIKNVNPMGIRVSLNQAVAASKGTHLLKLDGHCLVADGFVETLLRHYQDKSVMVARRFTLDLMDFQPKPRAVDYYYLSCPWTYPRGFPMMQSCPWIGYEREEDIDDLMCFQGSMWFMSKEHWNWLGGFETDLIYAEHHEISFKTWLGGRRVTTNKKTWYAHPSRSISGYRMDMNEVYRSHEQSARYWTGNQWPAQVYDFDWLIEKFWPLPTEDNHHRLEKYVWPLDWRKYYAN